MGLENILSAWRARAAQFFFLIIIFSFPIFSVPCGKTTCSSPAEVVATYGYSNRVFSEDIAKILVYPGACLATVENVVADNAPMQWPAWDAILNKFNVSNTDNIPPPVSLGFVAGCVLSLWGGAFSMFGPSVFSLMGMLLVLYYITTEGTDNEDITAMPMFALAVICSFGWLTFDMFTRNAPQKPTGILKKQL